MTGPATIRAADALARRLHAAGCRYAFGMPGGEVLTLVDALRTAGIDFVLARHETAAGFMAEGVHHRTGAPGILVATVGPGALNGVNAVANALQDRVPLIVLTGAVDADEAQTYTHQVLDQCRLFAPITKATFTLTPGAAHVIADKAVAIATEGRPGPVHIDVAVAVADAVIAATAPPSRPAAMPVVPAKAELAGLRAALEESERPLIVAGVDAVNGDAAAQVAALARVLGAPVVTTYKAKGLLPEDDPLALGGAGLSPLADRTLLPLIARADAIVCAGYDPIEMRTGWRDPWDPARATVIDVAAAPNHHYMHQATHNVVGDVAATLAALTPARRDTRPGNTWPGGEVAAARRALALAFPRDAAWGPAAVIDTCRSTLPRGTLATADSGAHRILLSQMWRCDEARGLMQSSALCTMGCAVPLAIGARLASPDRPVVSFSGDAGFLMVAGELATAAELALPVIFVVFVDASLALIEMKQRGRQLANAGVDFARHDIAAIGRAFGGAGHRVTDRAGLRAALTAALAAPRFTVIAAEISRGAYDGCI